MLDFVNYGNNELFSDFLSESWYWILSSFTSAGSPVQHGQQQTRTVTKMATKATHAMAIKIIIGMPSFFSISSNESDLMGCIFGHFHIENDPESILRKFGSSNGWVTENSDKSILRKLRIHFNKGWTRWCIWLVPWFVWFCNFVCFSSFLLIQIYQNSTKNCSYCETNEPY